MAADRRRSDEAATGFVLPDFFAVFKIQRQQPPARRGDEDAVADRVIYSSNVVGPVAAKSAIDPDTQEFSLEVLGQTVVINLITRFKETTFFDIDVNDVVVVSGYRNFDGSIRATFIEKINVFRMVIYG